MNGTRPWILFGLVYLILTLVLACASGATPAPQAKPGEAPATAATVSTPTTTATSRTTPPSTATASKATSAPAAAPVSFAGKTITIAVASAAGGGTDILARIFAKFLPKYLPGNPTAIVRNIPGGEGTIGGNFVYASKPDGLTILLAATTVLMADLLEKPGLQFRGLAKWTAFWAGTGANAYYFKPTIFEKPEDIVKSKGIIYGQSAGVASYTFLVVKEFVGIPTERVILGYGGSAEGRRAFHAGETTGTSESNWGYEANLRPYVEKGEVKILFQTGAFDEAGNIIRHPGLPPDILTGKELYEKIYGKAPSGLAYEAYKTFIAISLMEKLMIVPPGVPQEISRTYWVALQNVVKDPEVQKMGLILPTDPAGEAADKLLKDRYGIAPDVRTWLRDLLAKKYDLVL